MPTTHNLLEGTISTRRPPHAAEDGGGGGEAADESKTRKHMSVAIRVTNYLTRTGYVWPVLVTTVAVVAIYTLVVRSRDLVPSSSTNGISRLFFPIDGVESDFGSLGVPWCKSSYFRIIWVSDTMPIQSWVFLCKLSFVF